MLAITLALQLISLNIIGICIQKLNIVTTDFSAQLTRIIMKVLFPAMIFQSVRGGISFSMELFQTCLLTMVSGAFVMAASLMIGQAVYMISGKSGLGRIIRYSLTFTNYSFMGIPVMAAFLGETGTLLYMFFIFPVRIMYFTMSEPLMTPAVKGQKHVSFVVILKRSFTNPCIIAFLTGIAFWIFAIPLPEIIDYCVRQLSNLCSPLGLILSGLILGKYQFKRLLNIRYLLIPGLRLMVMPAFFFLLTRMAKSMGMNPIICNMIVIYAALPTAGLLPAYAMQYDTNSDNQFNAASACVMSALLAALALPLWYTLATI